MSVVFSNLRHAWRSIRRTPIISLVIVASLAIGIGVNTAVFSWIDLVVLRPLPGVPDGGAFQLVEPRADTGSYPGVSWVEYHDLRDQIPAIQDLFAFRLATFNVGQADHVERTFGQLVSDNYFAALQLKPALGRFFRPDEVQRGRVQPIVVISHDFWTTRLGADSSVVGRTVRINDRVVTIIGVAPPRFQGTVLGLSFDLWVPATLAPELLAGSSELDDRSLRGYTAMGRLRPRASREQAQAQFDHALRQLAQTYPQFNSKLQARILPFWQAPRGPQQFLVSALVTLQAILVVLLLAVCGNTANLLLARASARQREVAIRLALGASPARVLMLALTEAMLLAGAGAVLGTMIAIWATTALRSVPMITAFPIKFQTRIDMFSLLFAMALGGSCSLLFGIAPALQIARVDPQVAMRGGSTNVNRSRLRYALMAVEIALAAIVLIAAGVFYRSFADALDLDPGFRREGVLLAAYDLSGRNITGAAANAFAARVLDRVRALPGVEAAAIASSVPLDIHGLPLRAFEMEGRAPNREAPDQALSNVVTPGYFGVMGIPLHTGRDFAELRDAAAPPQVIVNDEFVRRFVDEADPARAIGRRVEIRNRSYRITGVVRNSVSESFGEPPTPVLYLSYRDRPSTAGEIHVRTRPGTEAFAAPQIERAVHDLDPSLPVYDVRTLSDHIDKNLFLRRIPARMFVGLGPLLLALAGIGIYAVVAYTVSQRTSEIGVRLVLGATGQRVVSQMVGESLRIVTIGAMAGWVVALLVCLHLVRGSLYLSVFIGVPAVLLLVAGVACWLPARTAASLEPIVALRCD